MKRPKDKGIKKVNSVRSTKRPTDMVKNMVNSETTVEKDNEND